MRREVRARALAGVLLVTLGVAGLSAASFTDWSQRQALEIPTAGLVRLTLPAATLDASRPGLEDLRITDAAGNEVPFLIERPAPEPPSVAAVKSLRPTLQRTTTTLLIETGATRPVNAVTLETPEREFIKGVRVEASQDGQTFATQAEGVPVFRQSGVSELTVRFAAGMWPWLRLTLDDERSRPAVFTGARVHAASGVDAPEGQLTASIKSRDEAGGETRLALDLGAANLALSTIEFETPETLFQREIVVSVPEVAAEEIREVEVGRGAIYSVNLGAANLARRLKVALDRQVRSRELIVVIRNFDSPPLAISAVRVGLRPVSILFQARQAGPHFLLAGNSQCPAPRYDLAALAAQLKNASALTAVADALRPNPDFHQPETLPGLADTAAALDTAPWRFRKPLQLARPGPQQLELDLQVLARARDDLGDLRLVRDGKQVPYLLERTSLTRTLVPTVTTDNDPKRPQLSRWKLTLAQPNLPLTRLECRARTSLFQRNLRAWEEVSDGRGGKYARDLGRAEWRRTLEGKELPLVISLNARPQTDTLYLDTDNGDNPPLELDSFKLAHSVTRLVFKTGDAPMLYYGNPAASAPRYDLSLVAPKLLAAEKAPATLGAEETLKKAAWTEGEPLTGVLGWLFWGILAVVVVGLLVVIARLLPKPLSAPEDGTGQPKQ
jgi:hypothetical protein